MHQICFYKFLLVLKMLVVNKWLNGKTEVVRDIKQHHIKLMCLSNSSSNQLQQIFEFSQLIFLEIFEFSQIFVV